MAEYFGDGRSMQEFRVREVVAREKEATARMMEATASSNMMVIQQRVTILRERKKLLDDNVCTVEELDQYLPMPKTSL
jgi:hypothetical protein